MKKANLVKDGKSQEPACSYLEIKMKKNKIIESCEEFKIIREKSLEMIAETEQETDIRLVKQ